MKLLFLLLAGLSISSCVSNRDLVNFQPRDPVAFSPQEMVDREELTVQSEDLLRITVSSLNPEAAAPFNEIREDNQRVQSSGGQDGTLALELTTGYFVDVDGYLDFPVLGPIFVRGLTLEEVKREIVNRLANGYLKNPVVNIRFLNFKVTVLGEVNAPGLIRLSNKRVTVLEALGIAGDLTVYANRTNILVMREAEGERTFARLDLQNDDIFSSPFYYLEQNDVIYVEPIQARAVTVADPVQRIVRYVSASLSLISIVVALATR